MFTVFAFGIFRTLTVRRNEGGSKSSKCSKRKFFDNESDVWRLLIKSRESHYFL